VRRTPNAAGDTMTLLTLERRRGSRSRARAQAVAAELLAAPVLIPERTEPITPTHEPAVAPLTHYRGVRTAYVVLGVLLVAYVVSQFARGASQQCQVHCWDAPRANWETT